MPYEWNAAAYARLSDPQFSWGRKLVQELRLRGDEVVLDAGCGAGRVTAELLNRLPRGRVIALDLSYNMVAEARQALAGRYGPHAGYVQADLQALPFAGAFEGVFSSAVFHWVPDHEALFAAIFAALKPGGWLVAQCGGGPNLARLRARTQELMRGAKFSPYFADWTTPWRYPDPELAARQLRQAGFREVRTWLEEAPVHLPDAQTFREFERNVTLHRHLARVPDPVLREEFLDELARAYERDDPAFTLDYWRLNIRAGRA